MLCLCKLIISGGLCYAVGVPNGIRSLHAAGDLSSEAPVYPPPPHPHPPQFKTYVPLAGHTVRAKKRKSVLILQFFVESKTGSKESEDRTVNPEAFSDVDLVLPIGHLGMWNKAMIYLSDCQR